MLWTDILVCPFGNVVRGDDLDENFLEVVLAVFGAEFGEGAFGEEFAGLDDADGVAELFDFTHDVSGEDYGFAGVAAFADEGGDSARGHDVEAKGGFIENHYWRIVDQGAGDGSFLLHAGGEFVAAALAEGVHIQAIEDGVEAFSQREFVEA